MESQTKRNGTNQADMHLVSVAKYTVLPGFIIISKLLIWVLLHVNHSILK